MIKALNLYIVIIPTQNACCYYQRMNEFRNKQNITFYRSVLCLEPNNLQVTKDHLRPYGLLLDCLTTVNSVGYIS